MDADSSFLSGLLEDDELLYSGARDEGNTQNTSDYDVTMDFYIVQDSHEEQEL